MAEGLSAIPYVHVASADVGSDAAFEVFATAVGDVFAITRIGDAARGPYRMEMTAWHLGTLMLGVFRSDALRFDRPADLVARGGLDHLLVQLYVDGSFTGDAEGVPIAVHSGDICVFDLTHTLRTEATAFANLSLLVPRVCFEAAIDNVDALHGTVLPRESPMAGVLASYLRALAERMPDLPPGEAQAAADATAALVTTVLAHCARPVRQAAGGALVSPFRRAAAYVHERVRDPDLDAEAIGRSLGMSRATLYRVFEPVGGVAAYIRRRRLTAAAVDLATPENARRTVAEIGFAWGFASEATFKRAFKSAFGIPPGAARSRGAQIWIAGHDQPDRHDPASEFVRWMRDLQGAGRTTADT